MSNLISYSSLKEDLKTPDHVLQAVFDVISKPTDTAADISSFCVGACNTSYADVSGNLPWVAQLVIRRQSLGK